MERDRIKTIKSLLEADFDQLPVHRIHEFEKTDRIQQLRRHLHDNVPDHQWHLIRQEMLSQMAQLLEIPLSPILIKSWHTHEAVKREITQQQANREHQEASIVVLDAHEIRSTHSPTLATKIGQDYTIDLRFFIGVVLQLKNISLKVQCGEIKSVLAGVLSGHGFMQYQNATLIEQDFRHLKLAGDIDSVVAPIPQQELHKPSRPQKRRIPSTPTQTQPTKAEPVQTIQTIATANHFPNSHQHVHENVMTTENQQEKNAASVIKTNVLQFTMSVLLALALLFLFWQFGRG